jgi:hypothetical protein
MRYILIRLFLGESAFIEIDEHELKTLRLSPQMKCFSTSHDYMIAVPHRPLMSRRHLDWCGAVAGVSVVGTICCASASPSPDNAP